jgi:hypothetical protein
MLLSVSTHFIKFVLLADVDLTTHSAATGSFPFPVSLSIEQMPLLTVVMA